MDSNYFFDVAGLRFGFQRSPIQIGGSMYMIRYILYMGWLCIRAHKFYRGDDDRAPHDHPWWFITIPLKSYVEDVFVGGDCDLSYSYPQLVKAWRPHFRPALYRHIVKGTGDGKPFWSLVIAGRPMRYWGFWPRPDKFVGWREWR